MTTEERISKIANKRVQLDNESAAKMKQRIDTICNLTDRIKACQPRIAALMKVCAALCENKISIGKKIYRLGGYDEEFIAEGFFHKIGFYFVRFNRSNYLRGIGIRGGGACGNDFAVDERGFIFENPLNKAFGMWTEDNAYYDFKNKAECFLKGFADFEKAVYEYVDNL